MIIKTIGTFKMPTGFKMFVTASKLCVFCAVQHKRMNHFQKISRLINYIADLHAPLNGFLFEPVAFKLNFLSLSFFKLF